jgi:hypothetical protein
VKGGGSSVLQAYPEITDLGRYQHLSRGDRASRARRRLPTPTETRWWRRASDVRPPLPSTAASLSYHTHAFCFRWKCDLMRSAGVSRHSRGKRWAAKISANGQSVHIGHFTDELAAALAYDKAARIHHGASAKLNFPDKDRPGPTREKAPSAGGQKVGLAAQDRPLFCPPQSIQRQRVSRCPRLLA